MHGTDLVPYWLQVAEREDGSAEPALLFDSRSTHSGSRSVGSEGWVVLPSHLLQVKEMRDP